MFNPDQKSRSRSALLAGTTATLIGIEALVGCSLDSGDCAQDAGQSCTVLSVSSETNEPHSITSINASIGGVSAWLTPRCVQLSRDKTASALSSLTLGPDLVITSDLTGNTPVISTADPTCIDHVVSPAENVIVANLFAKNTYVDDSGLELRSSP